MNFTCAEVGTHFPHEKSVWPVRLVSHKYSYCVQSHQNGVCTITHARTCAEEEHVRVALKWEASSIFISAEQVRVTGFRLDSICACTNNTDITIRKSI